MNIVTIIVLVIIVYLIWRHDLISLFTGKRLVVYGEKNKPPVIIPIKKDNVLPYFGNQKLINNSPRGRVVNTMTGTNLSDRVGWVRSFEQAEGSCKQIAYDHILTQKGSNKKYSLAVSYDVEQVPARRFGCRIYDNIQQPIFLLSSQSIMPGRVQPLGSYYYFNE